MKSQIATRTCAVFIDGAEMSSSRAVDIMKTANLIGKVACVKVFADFTNNTHRSWGNPCRAYNMDAIQVFEDHRDKWLRAPCVEQTLHRTCVLFKEDVDDIIIASGNGNYAHLARQLKDAGKGVIGISTTPDSTRKTLAETCDSFVYLDESSHTTKKCDAAGFKSEMIRIIREKSTTHPYPVSQLLASMKDANAYSQQDVLKFVLELDEQRVLVTFDRQGTPYVEYIDAISLFPSKFPH